MTSYVPINRSAGESKNHPRTLRSLNLSKNIVILNNCHIASTIATKGVVDSNSVTRLGGALKTK